MSPTLYTTTLTCTYKTQNRAGIFTHLQLCLATAILNLKRVKIINASSKRSPFFQCTRHIGRFVPEDTEAKTLQIQIQSHLS